MPWKPQLPRRRPEEGATTQDVYGGLRVVLNHAGGIINMLSSIALAVSRQESRLNAVADDMAALRLHMLGADLEGGDNGGDETSRTSGS